MVLSVRLYCKSTDNPFLYVAKWMGAQVSHRPQCCAVKLCLYPHLYSSLKHLQVVLRFHPSAHWLKSYHFGGSGGYRPSANTNTVIDIVNVWHESLNYASLMQNS